MPLNFLVKQSRSLFIQAHKSPVLKNNLSVLHTKKASNFSSRYFSSNQSKIKETKMSFSNRISELIFKKLFHNNLKNRIINQLSEHELKLTKKQIDELSDTIFNENRGMIIDEPSKLHLRGTSEILATYKVLLPKIKDKDKVINILEETVSSIGSKAIRIGTKLMLDFSRDPLKSMEDISVEKMKESYGETFKYEHERDGKTYFNVKIKKCFYHDFFKANNASELTSVLCNWDKNWFSAINPKKHGIEFERPTTLALGGSECPFKFKKLSK